MNTDKTERNQQIHEAWKNAGGYANQGILSRLAEEHGVSRERIWSIVKKIEESETNKVPSKVMFDAVLPGCKVSVATRDRLTALAKERGWSVAFTLRQCVEAYLKAQEPESLQQIIDRH